MKRLLSIFIFLSSTGSLFAQEFYVQKVNHIEKLWVIPPDRRSFIGSRGIQKFDYGRPILDENRGEHYVVTWQYSGKGLARHVVLLFEYRPTLNPKASYAGKCAYKGLKRGTYKWVFKNTGARFVAEGKIDRWKVSLVLDGKVAAVKRSATWYAMEGT